MVTKKSAKPVPAAEGDNPVRSRILEAAFSAFMERGFAETSTLEIATRARASKRELYAEFGSNQDMLVACIRPRAERLKLPVDLPELAPTRAALREIMRRALTARLLDGEPPELAEHFFGLLWGSKMLGLLLNTAERPAAREIAARAERAASAFLLAYPAPGP